MNTKINWTLSTIIIIGSASLLVVLNSSNIPLKITDELSMVVNYYMIFLIWPIFGITTAIGLILSKRWCFYVYLCILSLWIINIISFSIFSNIAGYSFDVLLLFIVAFFILPIVFGFYLNSIKKFLT